MENNITADRKAPGWPVYKLEANPGEEYMFRERALGSGAITEIFGTVQNHFKDFGTRTIA